MHPRLLKLVDTKSPIKVHSVHRAISASPRQMADADVNGRQTSRHTWISRWKLGSMVSLNGLFHLLINGIYWGYNPLIRSPLIPALPGTSKYKVWAPEKTVPVVLNGGEITPFFEIINLGFLDVLVKHRDLCPGKPVISNVITPLVGVKEPPVIRLFSAIYRGYNKF